MSTSTYTGSRPARGKGLLSKKVPGFKHEKEAGWHYRVAEKGSQANNFLETESEASEEGYELVEDSARKSLWRLPISDHEAVEQGYRDEGNSRLKSRAKVEYDRTTVTDSGDTVSYEESTNKVEVKEMSAQELLAGMRE